MENDTYSEPCIHIPSPYAIQTSNLRSTELQKKSKKSQLTENLACLHHLVLRPVEREERELKKLLPEVRLHRVRLIPYKGTDKVLRRVDWRPRRRRHRSHRSDSTEARNSKEEGDWNLRSALRSEKGSRENGKCRERRRIDETEWRNVNDLFQIVGRSINGDHYISLLLIYMCERT